MPICLKIILFLLHCSEKTTFLLSFIYTCDIIWPPAPFESCLAAMVPQSMHVFHLSDLMEIIAWLLHPNESQRATLQDIRRDPWVQQPIRIDDYKWKKVLPNCGE